jgi:DNA repair exonuclease SbcCD ATPase subunit/DNA repair exonuclease SbcCD nuclease subunit
MKKVSIKPVRKQPPAAATDSSAAPRVKLGTLAGNIKKIIHLSDIHIRPLQRHEEFQEVFRNTLDFVSKQREAIAVITGDIFDNKTVFRPETFKVCRDFLKSLASQLPVYLIAGNHDMLESNVSRLDSLTPLVEDITGLEYLKYTGVYDLNDKLAFVVSSLYDKGFIKRADIPDDGKKYIALFHGTVVGAKTDEGYEVTATEDDSSTSERHKTLDMFSGYDAVLLGDIHKRQKFTLDNGAIAAYAGSLIQQNYGEHLTGHGLLVWDISTLTPCEVDIPNDYGHVDVHIVNGNWTNPGSFPKKSYVRYIIKDSTEEQVNIINHRVKQLTEIVRTDRRQCIGDIREMEEIPPEVIQQGDELELIREQAIEMNITPGPVMDLHKEYQAQLGDSKANEINTAIWRPISMEFKNMFGYGGDRVNRVNFKNGVTSITAANATGKTSIVNILLFAIFGRTPLNPSANSFTYDVIHSSCSSGYVKICMEHGGNKYIIDRRTVKKAAASRTSGTLLGQLNKYEFSCELWRCDEAFNPVENMSDVRKKNTDAAVIELFGDIEDFSIANFLNKESSSDILTMSPADQIKALKRLFRLNIYDEYRDMNKTRLGESLTAIQQALNRKTFIESSIASMPVPEEVPQPEEEVDESSMQEMEENLNALELERDETVQQIIRCTERIDTSLQVLSTQECNREIADNNATLETIHDDEDQGKRSDVLAFALNQIKQDDLSAEDVQARLCGLTPTTDSLLTVTAELKSTKSRLAALPVIDYNGHSEVDIRASEKEIRELMSELKSLPTDFDRDRLEYLKSQETDDDIAEAASLEENTRDIHEINRKIKQLKSQQHELEHIRSNRTDILESREELEARLQDVGRRQPYDVSQLPQLKATVDALVDRIRKGEVGRIDRLLGYLTAEEITQDDIDEIIQYLNEKRSGNYDPSIVRDNQALAKYQAQLVEMERLVVINDIIAKNAEILADLAELDYLSINEQISDLDAELELLYISRDIILNSLASNKIITELSELQKASVGYERRQEILTRIDLIQQQIYAQERYDLEGLEEELTSKMEYLDLKTRYDNIIARGELETKLAAQLNYERRRDILNRNETLAKVKSNNLYKKQRTALEATLAEIQADIAAQRDSIAELREELELSKRRKQHNEHYCAERQRLTEQMTATEQEIVALQLKHIPYENYAKIMNPKGITAKLLYTKIRSIQDYINSIIEQFTKYKVDIIYDDTKQTISILTENLATGAKLSITRLSGYEKLMLQLAFKRALNKFSYNSKSSLIIIDEALDCIDQDNFASKLPDVISLLAQDYGVTVAISQRDITHISDNVIRLATIDRISRVLA